MLAESMRERGHLFLPVLAILSVMYSGYSAPLAALAGVLACFPVAALRKSTRPLRHLAKRRSRPASMARATRCRRDRPALRRHRHRAW